MFMGLFLSAFSAVAPPADSINARDSRTVVAVCFIEAAFSAQPTHARRRGQTKGMNLAAYCSEQSAQKHCRARFLRQKRPGGRWPRPGAHRAVLRASAMR